MWWSFWPIFNTPSTKISDDFTLCGEAFISFNYLTRRYLYLFDYGQIVVKFSLISHFILSFVSVVTRQQHWHHFTRNTLMFLFMIPQHIEQYNNIYDGGWWSLKNSSAYKLILSYNTDFTLYINFSSFRYQHPTNQSILRAEV